MRLVGREDEFVRVIDNIGDLLGDDLRSEIGPGSKVRIAASAFSIFCV